MAVGNTNADANAGALSIGIDGRGIYVRATGSIRAVLCYPLRDSLLGRLEKGASGVPAVSIDLSRCRYMDSTFIGLLVAIDKKIRKASGHRLHVLAPSSECREIFTQIGLQDYLLIEQETPEPPADMHEISSSTERPGADFILKAHEALMETSEEARRKFALLKEMLEKKIKSEKSPKDNPEE